MVYTLTGSNSYARSAYLRQLKADFVAKYGPSAVESYSGEQLTPEIIASAFGGVSLFNPSRMVIIRNLAEAKDVVDLVLAQLKSVTDDTSLVIVEPILDKRTALYKTLKKDTDFHDFVEPTEAEVINWIQAEVTQLGGTIAVSAARELYEYCGADQSRLSNELQKLVSYSSDITHDSIEQLVERNPRDTIFELLELAMGGQCSRAVAKLQALESAHEDPFQIASMLIWQAHILAAVQTAGTAPDAAVAKAHKINPYVVSKTRRLTSRLSTTKLKDIINVISRLDTTLKTSSYDPWRALEQTLFAL